MQGRRTKELSQLVCLGLVAAASLTGANEWPQWRGPNRDGTAPGAAKVWPDELKQIWKVTVGEGHSSPVVSGTRVYQFGRQGNREVLAAYELANGKKVWEYGYDAPYDMNPAARGHGKGPKATPVIGGGRVCALGITGTLTCVDEKTGKPAWSHPNLGAALFGTASSPVIERGMLIAQTGRQGEGSVAAYSLGDGKQIWSTKTEGAAYSSPVVADIGGTRQVIVETQSNLAAFSAAGGDLLWKTPLSTPYDQSSVTPLVVCERQPCLVIYSGLANPLIAVRATGKSAEKVWENKDAGMYMSSPVLVNGRLFGLSNRNRGQFFLADTATGKTLWTSDGRQGENAAVFAYGNTAFALTTNAELLILRVAGNSVTETRRYTVAQSPTWASPAIIGGRVLIKDLDSLALWSAE
jgi:outer membrane protein assembly factor BamB